MSLISILSKLLLLVSIALSALCLTSCDEGDLDVAKGFVRSDTYTALIDTVSINLSSIKADSVQTSGRESGLVGYYNNPLIGSQKATSYFGITTPEGFSWDKEKQVIDSIALIIKPNGYSIGDTSSVISFQVYQLKEQVVKNNSGYLNNINHFDFEEEPLGTKELLIWPGEQKSIHLKLNQQLAVDIIDFIDENKGLSTYTTLFRENFKGFVLQTDTLLTNAIIGIDIDSDECLLRLYSHKSTLEEQEITTDFDLLLSTNHFTQIEESNLLSPWDQITSEKDRLNENQTDSECLIQNGNGYRIRIDFPHLNNLLEIKEQGRIVKAELVLRPVMDYIKYADLPSTIYINEIDKINSLGDFLYNTSGETLTPTLYKDVINNKNTYYSFDITNYINTRIQEAIVDTDQGLAISFTDSNAGTQLDYMVMGGYFNQNYKSELKIYYYYYDIQ